MDAILTNANPGGLSFTSVTFSNSGLDSIISVKLLHSMKTREFFRMLPGETPLQAEHRKGFGYTKADVSILGDYGFTFASLAKTHVDLLASQGRTTNLTKQNLFDWLMSIWPSLRTYFVNSIRREDPYSISLLCPYPAPVPIVAEFSDIVSPEAPAFTPPLQIHTPRSVPFSDLAIADSAQAHVTHAQALIRYPAQGAHVLAGEPTILMAEQGNQVSSTHTFTWFFLGKPSIVGIQVRAIFENTTGSPINVPVTLLVTNKTTGISDAIVSYVIVEP